MSISTSFLRDSDPSSLSSDISQKSEDAKEDWRYELIGRINVLDQDDDTVEDYLATYVPSNVPCPEPRTQRNAKTNPFAKWSPKEGEEQQSYPTLIRSLRTLTKSFPKNKQLAFLDTSQNTIPFPFAAFAHNHHGSKPDISVSFPGEILPVGDWQNIAMVIEAKSTSAQDPFPRQGTTPADTITHWKLAMGARNLMVAHGLLAVFVLGIYGDDVRIARFDHSCAVVSKPFSLKKDHSLLRQFFWRFVHPINVNIPFVGWDPTIRKLSADLRATVKKRLEEAGVGVPPEFSQARRALVYENATSTVCKAYVLYKLLDVTSRMFSRATMVWVAIEDNADLYDPKVPLKRVIVKESWRQIIRKPETEFYQRLERIPDNLRHGLPRVLLGGDLGERAIAEWKAAGGFLYCDDSVSITADDPGSKRAPSASSPLSNSSSSKSPATPSVSCSSTSSLSDDSDSESDETVPFPEQQTFTWRSTKGPDLHYRERSHMRFVIDIVGRPLTSFRSTRELVMAMRDALIGHKLAIEQAGVLHRDISVGNILIVENRDEYPFAGFLHDFDFSSMSDPDAQQEMDIHQDAKEASSSERPGISGTPLVASDKDKVYQMPKERTGTFRFMAIDLLSTYGRPTIHEAHHDVECYYWVLLWVVLRHTLHCFQDNGLTYWMECEEGNDTQLAGLKRHWVNVADDVLVKDNQPLTCLLTDLQYLVLENVVPSKIAKRVPLTHDTMLAAFNKALERTDWPEGDAAIPLKTLDPAAQAVVEATPSTVPVVEACSSIVVDARVSEDIEVPSPHEPAPGPGQKQSKRRRGNDDTDDCDVSKPKKKTKHAPTRKAPPRKAKEKVALARSALPRVPSGDKSASVRPKTVQSAGRRSTRARR